ncbi:MAG: serine/threonine protein kinase [Deltaproteobacteria bacterium]|nr:serine/threonine protein kinase [Deltaproteobacteria bacterium]
MGSRYRVTRFIKRGGMAEVHEGVLVADGTVQRRVAIKRLLPTESTAPWFQRAFVDEARIASKLVHPNIVSLIDFGVMEGRPFQVLEFVEGADLGELLTDAEKAGLGVPRDAALHIVIEIARALEHVHRAVDAQGASLGIVHRDVTPGNILLSWDGQVKLTDFGIARAFDRLERTAVGVVKGKLSYLAPELVRSETGDHRVDIFALGCVLHEILCGESPMEDRNARHRAAAGDRLPLSERLGEDVAAVVRRAVDPQPERRFQSASELARACEGLLSGAGGSKSRALLVEWLERVRKRRPALPSPAPLAEMFELRLLDAAANDDMPRFASVVLRPSFEDREETDSESTTRAPTFEEESTTSPALSVGSGTVSEAEVTALEPVEPPKSPPRAEFEEHGTGVTMGSPPTSTMMTMNDPDGGEVEATSVPATQAVVRPSFTPQAIVVVSAPAWMRAVTISSVAIALASITVAVRYALRSPEAPSAISTPDPTPPPPAGAVDRASASAMPTSSVVSGLAAPITAEPASPAPANAPRAAAGNRVAKPRHPPPRTAPPPAPTLEPPAPKEVSDQEIERRLDSVSKKLRAAASSIPLDELTPFEDRYLDLRGSFQPNLSSERREALRASLLELERAIDRSHHP